MWIHFVTGRLAEHSLRRVVAEVAAATGFQVSIDVLPITVAALMTPDWIARRISVPPGADRVLVPGYCEGDLTPIVAAAGGRPVERGPRDLRRLPDHFGRPPQPIPDYGRFDIEIVAEINHAPRYSIPDLLAEAKRLSAAGADIIDLGCSPGHVWNNVAEGVAALRDQSLRVSIDSFNPREIEPAAQAGAELVLSVNSNNREAACDWNCEVVVVPDDPSHLPSMWDTVDFLSERGVRIRLDPILEPIGFGFAASLGRFLETRRRYPDAEMFMGIGNLTELTDADSAAINVLLLGFCQELGIRGVLTTQVVHWARSAVLECALARQLVYHAVSQRVLPKHLEPRLIPLRGQPPAPLGEDDLNRLAAQIRDHNYRLFAEQDAIHLLSSDLHLQDSDPFVLFERLLATDPKNIDPRHAFYLGFEMSKALTALTLSKDYHQDEALDWGYLTRPETSHRHRSNQRP